MTNIKYKKYLKEETIYRKICKKYWKSVKILSNTCGYNSRVILASVDKLYFCLSWYLYFKRKLYQEENHLKSQTSKHKNLD